MFFAMIRLVFLKCFWKFFIYCNYFSFFFLHFFLLRTNRNTNLKRNWHKNTKIDSFFFEVRKSRFRSGNLAENIFYSFHLPLLHISVCFVDFTFHFVPFVEKGPFLDWINRYCIYQENFLQSFFPEFLSSAQRGSV